MLFSHLVFDHKKAEAESAKSLETHFLINLKRCLPTDTNKITYILFYSFKKAARCVFRLGSNAQHY